MSNATGNGVTARQETLTPTRPDPARPSPARPSPARPMLFWSPSIHSFRNVMQASAAPAAPTARPEWMVDEATTIDPINLGDDDIDCTGYGCTNGTHPANYIVEFTWPHGHHYRGARCHRWWVLDTPLQCCACPPEVDRSSEKGDVCRIVEWLR